MERKQASANRSFEMVSNASVRRWTAGLAGGSLGFAAAVPVSSWAPSPVGCSGRPQLTANRPLAATHRVALCGWPIKGARQQSDPRVADLRALFSYARDSGYDGIEFGCDDLKEMKFFDWSSPNSVVARHATDAARAVGFPRNGGPPSTGALYKITDGNSPPFPGCLEFSDLMLLSKFRQKLVDDQAMGAEYVTLQIYLPPRHLNSGGAYRRDTAFLRLSARRITELQREAHSLAMNFYVETHIDRVSEDIEAFCQILDQCPPNLELNGDLSHYLYRGIKQGKGLSRVLSMVGHMHQRMAREFGGAYIHYCAGSLLLISPSPSPDLSADVPDPSADWDAKGVTWQAFEYAKPALVSSCLPIGVPSAGVLGKAYLAESF